MNLVKDILYSVQNNISREPDYIRNIIKEIVQDYALNFIYSSDYKYLIFTGGSCLKKVYGLNRLSEDLDFDCPVDKLFNIVDFSNDLANYFKNLGYTDLTYKISGNNKTTIIKFDIANIKDELPQNISSNLVYLRCDFSEILYEGYKIEVNPIDTNNFSFFVINYDFTTLFANKIVAFLERDFYKGKFQNVPFKGRDVYDLFWMTSQSIRKESKIRPNRVVLFNRLKNNDINIISKELITKLGSIDSTSLYNDLLPLVSSKEYLNSFVENYKEYLTEKLPDLL